MKKNMILAGILVILLVILLTVIGLNIKKSTTDYKQLENKLSKAAIGYFGESPSLAKDGLVIDSDDLYNYDNTIDMNISGDTCTGYVKLTSNMGIYDYKAYIKCNNYITKGYSK